MPKPLEGGIAKEVLRGLKRAKMLRSATLIKLASNMRTPGQASAGVNASSTSYACKGFVSSTSKSKIGGTLVESGDVVICLIAQTLAVTPATRDKVTIDGTTHQIFGVDIDAATATFILLTRK
jgi:hypothetical protein